MHGTGRVKVSSFEAIVSFYYPWKDQKTWGELGSNRLITCFLKLQKFDTQNLQCFTLPQNICRYFADVQKIDSLHKISRYGVIHLVVRKTFWKFNISYPLIYTRTCAYQGVRNISFSENFACVINERSLCKKFAITFFGRWSYLLLLSFFISIENI